MAHLIDKDALVAEIERMKADALQKKEQCKRSGLERIVHQIGAYNKILSFINTLEVKEVDLDKTLTGFISRYAYENGDEYPSAIDIAKHFYELGLKAKQG